MSGVLRLGLSTPVVIQVPGSSGAWEEAAGIAEVTQVAKEADRLGFDHLTCSEHVAVPPQGPSVMLESGRGTMYYDPSPP